MFITKRKRLKTSARQFLIKRKTKQVEFVLLFFIQDILRQFFFHVSNLNFKWLITQLIYTFMLCLDERVEMREWI